MNAAESKRDRAIGQAKVIPLRPMKVTLPKKRRKTRQVRYVTPVSEAQREFDPLMRESRRSRATLAFVMYLVAAVALHAGTAALLMRLGDDAAKAPKSRSPKNVLVNIQEPVMPEPILEPEIPPAKEAPPAAEMQKIVPQRVSKASPKPAKRVREIPVDPVNVPTVPPKNIPPVRKVVGISFESTVTGGNGPATAVGNTRMGATGRRAEDPSKVQAVGGGPYRGPGTAPNRIATAIPTEGISLVKPKRISSVTPEYPSVLKAQGIEGDVAVLIRISAEGAVRDARVIKGSGQPAFDKAALDAAKKERFSPAVRGGEPIEYTLKYTYRFRVTG